MIKIEYSVNIKRTDSPEWWEENDYADWYDEAETAYEEAQKAFDDPEVEKAVIHTFINGEVTGFPLKLIREDGTIKEYYRGELHWL